MITPNTTIKAVKGAKKWLKNDLCSLVLGKKFSNLISLQVLIVVQWTNQVTLQAFPLVVTIDLQRSVGRLSLFFVFLLFS